MTEPDDYLLPGDNATELKEAVQRIEEIAKVHAVDPKVGDGLRARAKRTWIAREGVECFICHNELKEYAQVCAVLGHEPMIPQFWWCGYVRINRAMFAVPDYKGLLTYVPVSGGITLKCEDSEGCIIYGYDTNHAWDHEKPGYWTEQTMTDETNRFACALIVATRYETAYLEAPTSEARAQIIELYHAELREHAIEFELTENFGAMINVLFGKL